MNPCSVEHIKNILVYFLLYFPLTRVFSSFYMHTQSQGQIRASVFCGRPALFLPAETKKESDLVRFFPYLLPSLLIFHQARWGELYSHGWGGSVKWEHESSLAPMEILKQMLAQEFVGALARQVYGELFITVLGHWSFFGGGWRPLSP